MPLKDLFSTLNQLNISNSLFVWKFFIYLQQQNNN